MRKGLVIVLILVIGLVIAADRIGLMVAQDEIAKNVATQYGLDHKPTVKIKGFPFLNQALNGKYGEIDVNVGDFTQLGVHLTGTVVTLKGVDAPLSDAAHGDSSKFVADEAISTATVPYADVDKEAPKGMKVSAKGKELQVRGPVTVLGLSRTVTATVTVRASGRNVRIVPQTVDAGGTTVPVALVQQAFSFTMPVKGLPLNTRITDVKVQPDGLRVTTVGDHVNLESLNEH
ncbi:MAG: LmeA family phospholipid-binding protein [Actinoallomurus sp.]